MSGFGFRPHGLGFLFGSSGLHLPWKSTETVLVCLKDPSEARRLNMDFGTCLYSGRP